MGLPIVAAVIIRFKVHLRQEPSVQVVAEVEGVVISILKLQVLLDPYR